MTDRSAEGIVTLSFDFYWPAPPYPHDLARAHRLLAEAGHPNGFDAGDFYCDLQVCPWGEAMLTNFYLFVPVLDLEVSLEEGNHRKERAGSHN